METIKIKTQSLDFWLELGLLTVQKCQTYAFPQYPIKDFTFANAGFHTFQAEKSNKPHDKAK